MGNNLCRGNNKSKTVRIICGLRLPIFFFPEVPIEKLSRRLLLSRGPLSYVAPLMEGVPWLDRKLPLWTAGLSPTDLQAD